MDNLATIFPKDGDEDGTDEVTNVNIEVASNGYIAVFTYGDGDEVKEVFVDKNELLKELRKVL